MCAWLVDHGRSANYFGRVVVATPCPLILAVPVAVISGINRAAQIGIIVKGGTAIERIGHATAVVFDKTGTLTVGMPAFKNMVLFADNDDNYAHRANRASPNGAIQLDQHDLLRLAGS